MTAVRGHRHSLFGLSQKDEWTVERELGGSYVHVIYWLPPGAMQVSQRVRDRSKKGLDVLDIEKGREPGL